jgi:glutaredoxin
MNETQKEAHIYRMVTEDHVCPFGIKSKDLLKRNGYHVVDHKLKSRQEIDQYKNEANVKTTPQNIINGKRIGGHEDLKKFLGKEVDNNKSYAPIIAIFSTTFIIALIFTSRLEEEFIYSELIKSFIALSMTFLAVLKLRDLESFSNQFITYDILARRYVPYAYFYPFIELIAGLFMLAKFVLPIAAVGSLFIGTIGATSVIKAVYIERRDLKCACVGGNSKVPLGAISLTENLMMILMGVFIFMNL